MRIKTILLTAALTLGALTLTACEGQNLLSPKPPDLNKLFTFSASISCETGNFSALFTRTAMGSWDITLTEPYELQGITFSRTKEGVKASLENLSAKSLTSEFSDSPLTFITDSIESAVQNGNASVVYGDQSYAVNSGNTVMYFQQGSAVPEAFEIPEKQIKGEISEFNITGEIFRDGADVVLML